MEGLWDEETCAQFLHVTRATLANRRSAGKNHPPYRKIGGKVVYIPDEVTKWVTGQPICRELADGRQSSSNLQIKKVGIGHR